jgi:hypothetical protein
VDRPGADGVRHYEQMDVEVAEALDDDRTVVRRLLQL